MFFAGSRFMFIIFALVLLGAMGFSIVLPSIMFVAEDFGGGEAMAGDPLEGLIQLPVGKHH